MTPGRPIGPVPVTRNSALLTLQRETGGVRRNLPVWEKPTPAFVGRASAEPHGPIRN